jgi:hypothetical protein
MRRSVVNPSYPQRLMANAHAAGAADRVDVTNSDAYMGQKKS